MVSNVGRYHLVEGSVVLGYLLGEVFAGKSLQMWEGEK